MPAINDELMICISAEIRCIINYTSVTMMALKIVNYTVCLDVQYGLDPSFMIYGCKNYCSSSGEACLQAI